MYIDGTFLDIYLTQRWDAKILLQSKIGMIHDLSFRGCFNEMVCWNQIFSSFAFFLCFIRNVSSSTSLKKLRLSGTTGF